MGQRALFTADLLLVVSIAMAADVYYFVQEESSPGLLIGIIPDSISLVNLVSRASLPYMRYSFLSIDSNLRKYFSLNDKTGELLLSSAQVLDREVVCQYDVTCNLDLQVAIQSTHTQFFRKVLVSIDVIDINDHAPYFKENSTLLTISESVQIPTSFPLPSATDKDTSVNNSLQGYEIFPKGGPFELSYSESNPNLMLRVIQELDHEITGFYSLRVIARDNGNPPREGVLSVDVVVEDVNDNAPKFTQENYAKIVDETVNQGSLLLTLSATDADSGKNGQIRYRLSPEQPRAVLSMFAVDELLGDFRLIGDFQNSDTELYRVEVEARDMADQPFTARTTVTIQVEDTINSRPKMVLSYLSQNNFSSISEFASTGVAVAHILVKDIDRGPNGVVQCRIVEQGSFQLQNFDENEYNVIVSRPLDREHTRAHNVSVECSDTGVPPLRVWESFQVRITDENDNTPKFTNRFYNITIRENNEIDKEILRVVALDEDDPATGNGRVTYSLQDVAKGEFLINPDTGVIKAMTSFDFEIKRQINFTVTAEDSGNPRRSAKADVIVNVLDENDQVPSFTQSRFIIAVSEYAQPGDLVGEIKAFDFEKDKNGQFDISLIAGTGRCINKQVHDSPKSIGPKDSFITEYDKIDDKNLPFSIQPNGSLILTGEIDHEIIASYEFEVRVTDKGDPPLSDTANVVIGVKDENDNRPEVVHPNTSEASFTALTGPEAPSTLFGFEVVDRDSGINSFLVYTVTARNDSGRFTVDSDGQVKRSRDFSNKDIGTYKFSVVVRDSGTPPLSDVRTFFVHIKGGNDTSGTPGVWNGHYMIITVTLVCATILLSITIVLVMVIMKRLDNRRKSVVRSRVHVRSSPAIVDPAKADIVDFTKADMFKKERHESDDKNDEIGNTNAKKTTRDPHFGFSSSTPNINVSSVLDCQYKIPAIFPEDALSDSSGETTASDSGRGGSDEDISISNMAERDSNEEPSSYQQGNLPFCVSTFNPEVQLKSSVKQPIRSSQRKHVTFKDMKRLWNVGKEQSNDPEICSSQRDDVTPASSGQVTLLANSFHCQLQEPVGSGTSYKGNPHLNIPAINSNCNGSAGSYKCFNLEEFPQPKYRLERIPVSENKIVTDSCGFPSGSKIEGLPQSSNNHGSLSINRGKDSIGSSMPNKLPCDCTSSSPISAHGINHVSLQTR